MTRIALLVSLVTLAIFGSAFLGIQEPDGTTTAAGYIAGAGTGATGGMLVGMPICDRWVAINQTASATVISGVAARKVYICAINLVTTAANNIAVVGGTGTACVTTQHAISGGTTAATGWNFAANSGIAYGSGVGAIMQSGTAADDVCILQSAGTQVSGAIAYAIY